jgi:hypothetical protein
MRNSNRERRIFVQQWAYVGNWLREELPGFGKSRMAAKTKPERIKHLAVRNEALR